MYMKLLQVWKSTVVRISFCRFLGPSAPMSLLLSWFFWWPPGHLCSALPCLQMTWDGHMTPVQLCHWSATSGAEPQTLTVIGDEFSSQLTESDLCGSNVQPKGSDDNGLSFTPQQRSVYVAFKILITALARIGWNDGHTTHRSLVCLTTWKRNNKEKKSLVDKFWWEWFHFLCLLVFSSHCPCEQPDNDWHQRLFDPGLPQNA